MPYYAILLLLIGLTCFGDIRRMDAIDIANAVSYAVTQPSHVSLNEILIRPTGQEG